MSRVGLVFSMVDEAGKGIANVLTSLVSVREVVVSRDLRGYLLEGLNTILVGFNENVTEFEFLDDLLDVDYYIILSKHSSAQRIKSFTVHHVGIPIHDLNLCRTLRSFPRSNPSIAKSLLLNLLRFRDELGLSDFTVTYEVTHHGPFNVKKPLTFVELGSSVGEWVLKEAQEVVARAVVSSLSYNLTCVSTVGIGGNHYANLFTSRALGSDECYGHIIPNYVLRYFKEDVEVLEKLINYAINYSSIKTVRVVIDDKVPSTPRKLAKDLGGKLGIEIVIV